VDGGAGGAQTAAAELLSWIRLLDAWPVGGAARHGRTTVTGWMRGGCRERGVQDAGDIISPIVLSTWTGTAWKTVPTRTASLDHQGDGF